MQKALELPQAPELELDVMKLTNVKALKINSELLAFLEGVSLAIASGEIQIKAIRDEVRRIKTEVTMDFYEDLKTSTVKTNEEQRTCMIQLLLYKNPHYVAKTAAEEELEADLIRAKALHRSYTEYYQWYRDCLHTFNAAIKAGA